MSIEAAYRTLFTAALIVLAILIILALIRSVLGPRITDRILCINMIGTMVISSIVIFSSLLGEGYLLDVALIYAMISFVSVLVLASVYVPIREKRANLFNRKDTASAAKAANADSTAKKGGAKR